MTTASSSNEIRISPNPPVFDLPVLVAIEEKLFEKHGVGLSYSAEYTDRKEEHERRAEAAEGIAFRPRQGRRLQCLRVGRHRPHHRTTRFVISTSMSGTIFSKPCNPCVSRVYTLA
jgi:hypothetical protein